MDIDVDVLALCVATLGWIVGLAGYVWNRRENRRLQIQELRTLAEWFKGGRTFLKTPKRSDGVAWNRAYERIREARRRIGETLGYLPRNNAVRLALEELRDAFLEFADLWDEFGEFADTHGGQNELMAGLQKLQKTTKKAIAEIESELRKAGG